jgi:hypothetical protein
MVSLMIAECDLIVVEKEQCPWCSGLFNTVPAPLKEPSASTRIHCLSRWYHTGRRCFCSHARFITFAESDVLSGGDFFHMEYSLLQFPAAGHVWGVEVPVRFPAVGAPAVVFAVLCKLGVGYQPPIARRGDCCNHREVQLP